MSRVLVTGASGFIGSHLVDALVARGDEVVCLVRSSSRLEHLRSAGVELCTGDLEHPDTILGLLDGVQTVYHVAGIIRSFSRRHFMAINRDATERLAAACAVQSRPPRLILVSSVAAAGPAPRGRLRSECDAPAPVSNYGRSKLAGEQAAARHAHRVPLTIVRPGIVFGPRDRMFLKVLQTIRRLCVHPTPGFRPPPLSYIYVADLVELLLRVADRGSRVAADTGASPAAGRYFAVAPEYPTYAELGRLVRPLLGRPRALVFRVPAPIAWFVAGINEGVTRVRGCPHELNFDKIREALATSWACSGDRARHDLDFSPARSLLGGLEETISWYLDAGWL